MDETSDQINVIGIYYYTGIIMNQFDYANRWNAVETQLIPIFFFLLLKTLDKSMNLSDRMSMNLSLCKI